VRYQHMLSQWQAGNQESEVPDDQTMAKFVALSIEWPQAIGCLRANSDEFEKGKSKPLSVYACMEKKAYDLQKKKLSMEKRAEQWETFIKEKGFDFGEWVRDVNFLNFLATGKPLNRYTEAGLW